MAILLRCANGHSLRVKDDLVGRNIRCPKCQSVVPVRSPADELPDQADEFSDNEDDFGSDDLPRRPSRKRGSGKKKAAQRSPAKNATGLVLLGVGGAVAVLAGLGVFLFHRPAAARAPQGVQAVAEQPAADENSRLNPSPSTSPVNADAIRKAKLHQAMSGFAVAKTTEIPPRDSGPATTRATWAPETRKGIAVWDTIEPTTLASVTTSENGWQRIESQNALPSLISGDCVIDNGKMRLLVSRDRPQATLIAADGTSSPVAVPISLFAGKSKTSAAGAMTLHVVALSDHFAALECRTAQGGPKATCSIEAGKNWIELKADKGVDSVAVAINSRFVVTPTEFGEDLVCDPALCEPGQTVRVPTEPLLISLEEEGRFLTVLTYPSGAQAGSLTVELSRDAQRSASAAGGGSDGADLRVSQISAKYNGKSVFVGVLPRKDLWHFESINKKYSASGQYPLKWKPPIPGVWRMAGRVNGRYFINDVPSDRFVFACSLSGTLDCLLTYLSTPAAGAAGDIATPMSIYRETVGRANPKAPLLDTEADDGHSLMRRMTRYRDVCNSTDDMKDRWRSQRDTLKNEPDYVPSLLEDCRQILLRMDRRLDEYRHLTRHVGELAADSKDKNPSESTGGTKSTGSIVRASYARLKATNPIPVNRALSALDKIKQKIQQPESIKVAELDRIAEGMRDVANRQEIQLKRLRAATLQLAETCANQRKTAPPAVAAQLTVIGRHCRQVLRNRDPEE